MNTTLYSEKLNILDIQDTLTKSLELFKKKPGQLLLVTFIGMIISFFSLGLLLGLTTLNLFSIVKKLDEENQTPEVPKLFERLDRFVDSLILVLICVGVAIAVTIPFAIFGYTGSILAMIVATSITSPIYYLAFQILEEKEGATPLETFSVSFDVIKNSVQKVLSFGLIMGIFAALPALFPGLLSIPISALAHSFNLCLARVIYRQISNDSSYVNPESAMPN